MAKMGAYTSLILSRAQLCKCSPYFPLSSSNLNNSPFRFGYLWQTWEPAHLLFSLRCHFANVLVHIFKVLGLYSDHLCTTDVHNFCGFFCHFMLLKPQLETFQNT